MPYKVNGNQPSKSGNSAQELGLVSKDKLDYKKIRGETNEATQRPTISEKSEKTDRGTFQIRE